MYKIRKYSDIPATDVVRVADDAVIPLDEANTDYAAYLAWLAEGNEPEVIDL